MAEAMRKPALFPAPLSHPDKVFWPEDGYTKLDLAEFYRSIFPKLAPYVKDRALSLERCPDGLRGECFFQKEKPKGMPASTPTQRITHGEKTTEYVVGGSLATQIALVNLGCVAVHVMCGRAKNPGRPDWFCIDLDPESKKFADAARAAWRVKEALDQVGLNSFPKTSGGRGLHIWTPLRLGPNTEEVTSFARELVSRVAAAFPKELTVERLIAERGQRVYLDPFRNGFGQTVAAPYCVRLRPRAPVSTPLEWEEVKETLNPADFNISNFAKLRSKSSAWSGFFKRRQSLQQAATRLRKL